MTSYRIICTTQEPIHQPTTHAHIVAVGTGPTAQHYTQRWTLDQVLAAMDRGNTFYTLSQPLHHQARSNERRRTVARATRGVMVITRPSLRIEEQSGEAGRCFKDLAGPLVDAPLARERRFEDDATIRIGQRHRERHVVPCLDWLSNPNRRCTS